jgi:protein-L-isoaspartate(D-aspartate) O-methyltransferase
MTDTSPDALRARMVDRIVGRGWARDPHIAHAMRAVPRHPFVPDATITQAHDDRAVITKRDPSGTALSCASEPVIVAMMLDQADVHPGHRILEVGTGTGYNAALLAELAGPAGQVTTVDIDPDLTTRARTALHTTGHPGVHVITRDGALGDTDHAPYHRIIVTVGAFDLPPAWYDQLTPGGRLVVPLRWRGQTRSVAFTRTGSLLRSDSVELCGFVPMVGQDCEHAAAIDPRGHVTLHRDADQDINPAALHGVLDTPKVVVRSGVTVAADEPFDGIWLRLTAVEPRTCRIAADQTAVQSGLCTPAIPTRSPALAGPDSITYLTLHRTDEPARWELGATGHGPTGPDLADRLAQQTRAWARQRNARPTITAYPTTTEPIPAPTPSAKPTPPCSSRYDTRYSGRSRGSPADGAVGRPRRRTTGAQYKTVITDTEQAMRPEFFEYIRTGVQGDKETNDRIETQLDAEGLGRVCAFPRRHVLPGRGPPLRTGSNPAQVITFVAEMRAQLSDGGPDLDPTELTRTRHRLIRRRMISVEPSHDGHTVYSITGAGRARLGQIRVLMQMAPRLEPENCDENRTSLADQEPDHPAQPARPVSHQPLHTRDDRSSSGNPSQRSIRATAPARSCRSGQQNSAVGGQP